MSVIRVNYVYAERRVQDANLFHLTTGEPSFLLTSHDIGACGTPPIDDFVLERKAHYRFKTHTATKTVTEIRFENRIVLYINLFSEGGGNSPTAVFTILGSFG